MLSEAEQRRLTAIEAQLRAEDPAFAQQFGESGQGRHQSKWRGPATLLATVGAAAGAVTGLMAQSVGLVIVCLIVVAVAAGMWTSNRLGSRAPWPAFDRTRRLLKRRSDPLGG